MNRFEFVTTGAALALIGTALAGCASQKPAPDDSDGRDQRRPRSHLREESIDDRAAHPAGMPGRGMGELVSESGSRPIQRESPPPALYQRADFALGSAIDLGAPSDSESPVSAALPPAAHTDELMQSQSLQLEGVVPDDAAHTAVERELPDLIAALRRELLSAAAEADRPMREYLLAAALSIVERSGDLDPESLDNLDSREREILAAFHAWFQRLGDEAAASGEDAAMLRLLEDLDLEIRARQPLAIAAARFCTRVDGFGRYETFGRDAFRAGQPQQVVIYTEIEGFRSAEDGQGMWRTDLWQELAIHNADDESPLWQQEWQPAPDVAARRRTDFFISYVVTLPTDTLPAGSYTMRVRVKDDATGAIAEAAIPFAIVADE